MRKDKITGGLYLVIDPSPGIFEVLPKVEAAMRGGVTVLQIWNHWSYGQDTHFFVETICALAEKHSVPVLINENIELLMTTSVDGIHFDEPIVTPHELREKTGREIIYGITCGNDLARVRWAVEHNADYISFCSLYSSSSVNTCDLVSLDTVRKARAIAPFPIFASGGITPENAIPVLENGSDGIAVISGILRAENPEAAARRYVEVIERINHKRHR